MNKIDRMADKTQLLPFIESVTQEHAFEEIIPVSAEKGDGAAALLTAVASYLPEGEAIYDADDFTDRSERFLAAELLREKLFRNLGEELPYGIAVEIEKYEQEGNLRRIHAAVIVDKAVSNADIVITTAQIPGRKAPVLVKADTVAKMKPGSIIVDMAVGSGGNVEGSKPDENVVTANGVKIVGISNIPALAAAETSALYARNLLNFLQPQHDKETKSIKLNKADDMVKPTILVTGASGKTGAAVAKLLRQAA